MRSDVAVYLYAFIIDNANNVRQYSIDRKQSQYWHVIDHRCGRDRLRRYHFQLDNLSHYINFWACLGASSREKPHGGSAVQSKGTPRKSWVPITECGPWTTKCKFDESNSWETEQVPVIDRWLIESVAIPAVSLKNRTPRFLYRSTLSPSQAYTVSHNHLTTWCSPRSVRWRGIDHRRHFRHALYWIHSRLNGICFVAQSEWHVPRRIAMKRIIFIILLTYYVKIFITQF